MTNVGKLGKQVDEQNYAFRSTTNKKRQNDKKDLKIPKNEN